MEALLHQAALQPPPHTTKPSLPWRLSQPSPHVSPSKRTRAPTRLQAAGRGFGAAITDKKSSGKKKQKQQQQQQQQELMETLGDSKNSTEDDELPQELFDRILRRILFFIGFPMVSGVSLIFVFDMLKREHGWVVPAWLPLTTILLSFGTSAFGIAYGTLSSSWDTEKEGSLLGLEQAQLNWRELWKDEADKK